MKQQLSPHAVIVTSYTTWQNYFAILRDGVKIYPAYGVTPFN